MLPGDGSAWHGIGLRKNSMALHCEITSTNWSNAEHPELHYQVQLAERCAIMSARDNLQQIQEFHRQQPDGAIHALNFTNHIDDMYKPSLPAGNHRSCSHNEPIAIG
jgi:hypothetical protein